MTDIMSESERSARMALVRSSGNKSTEGKVEAKLIELGITGWEKQPKGIIGKPDFIFPEHKLLVFVDGCFWHACPTCHRRLPTTRAEYWKDKIDGNRRRDNRHRRQLREEGYHVMRIWEHEVKKSGWVKRLQAMLRRLETAQSVASEQLIEDERGSVNS